MLWQNCKFTKTDIREISVTRFPLVIFTDSHCHIKKIEQLQFLYPKSDIICLGDITDLFNKRDVFNKHSINFFAKSKIPCLRGNHEEHIISCIDPDRRILLKAKFAEDASLYDDYKLEKEQQEYLKSLAIGFKLILQNGKHYYCFHNRPNDLWSFTEKDDLTNERFLSAYPIEEHTLGVIHGHMHKVFTAEYSDNRKRHSVGSLRDGFYALLTEQGLEFKKL